MLACGANQLRSRVNMSREHVAVARRSGTVGENERWRKQRSINACKSQLGRWIACVPVMVSADQHHLHVRMERSPFRQVLEGHWRPAVPGMQKVAKKDDSARPCSGKQGIEASDSMQRGSMWNGNTTCAESCGFSEMRVRYEERSVALPKHGPFGKQRQCLTPDLDSHVKRHRI